MTAPITLTSLAEQLADFEDGALDDEQALDLFAALIASGLAWSLQGFYGRTAQALIDSGEISPDGEVLV